MNRLGAALMRPLLRLWFLAASTTWNDIPRPAEPFTSHASGSDPQRVLLIGCGPVVGYGVLSQDLALPGQMARQLAAYWGRGVDVDVIAEERMTAASAVGALIGAPLARYNGVVIVVGQCDSFRLTDPAKFRERMDSLLALVAGRVSSGIPVVIFGNPDIPHRRMITPWVARIARAHADLLDVELARSTAEHAGMVYLPFPQTAAGVGDRLIGADLYAAIVKQGIDLTAGLLDLSPVAVEIAAHDEAERQQALERMDILDTAPDERLTRLTAMARRLFGTTIAAITFLDGDRQWFLAVEGSDILEAPREMSFCDHTVRDDGPLIVPDAMVDPRFRDHPLVAGGPKLSFYAGYPIMSPTGYRVGAFCLFDVDVRLFTGPDTILLRDLALLVQDQIWLKQHTPTR